MRTSFLLLAATFGLAAIAPAQAKLTIGSDAPELKVEKWVKGEPVKKFEAGKVYVVEFWATWCGPCKESIPHITEMAKEHKDATFIGVSIWENPEAKDNAHIAKVEKFVSDMGSKMDYVVAADGFEGAMAKSWMEAAKQNGIPTAFIVDGKGKIAWIGHPMELDSVIGKVVAGTYDSATAAKQMEEEMKMEQEREMLFQPLSEAMANNDHEAVIKEIDKIIAKDPMYEMNLASVKFESMLRANEAEAYKYGDKLAEGLFKTNPMALNNIAWAVVSDIFPELAQPDLAKALAWAEKADKLSENKNPYIVDTLAYVWFRKGDMKKAIEIQTRAVKLAEADSEFDAITLTEMKERLEEFKKKG
ncbi:MAG: redoxin family protein [Fimbriimonadaceae bacterium]